MNAEALIGTVLGTCTLQKLIGQGGMGAVFLAQQSRPKRQVAVKVLLPMTPLTPNQLAAFLERFRRETDAAASLEHANIMPVHEYGERDGLAYLVMPYISGGTLRDELERDGALPLAKVTNYLDQMASALDFAHEHGVIHRDIKPANILLTPEGRLLLADFGLVKVLAEGHLARLTGAGAPVGTPDYMAPEQVIGDEIDGRADLYSLGVMLYQMVIGATPFQGATPMEIATQHLQIPPPSPRIARPDLPIATEQIMLRALAKLPAERYMRAQDLAHAFRVSLIAAGLIVGTNTGMMPGVAAPSSAGAVNGATGTRLYTPKGLFDPRWQTSSMPALNGGGTGLLSQTGMMPSLTNNALPMSNAHGGTGILSRAAITPPTTTTNTSIPLAGNTGRPGQMSMDSPLATTGSSIPSAQAPHAGSGLLSRTGKFSLIGTGLLPAVPSSGVARGTTMTPPENLLAATKSQSLLNPQQSSPALDSRGTGAWTVPGQPLGSNTVKLTGPVKVFQVPVAGQPGRYVTGILPVMPEAQGQTSEASDRDLLTGSINDMQRKSRSWIKITALVVLVFLLIGSVIGGALYLHNRSNPQTANRPAAGSVITTGNPAMATPGAGTTGPNANVILSDPLSNNIHNWRTTPSDTYAFAGGAYHITNHSGGAQVAILSGLTLPTAFAYTLTMQEVSGDDTSANNSFGMMFHFSQQQKGNAQVTTFYSFEVVNTKGGEYQFWKYDDSKGTSPSPWTEIWHTPFGNEYHLGQGPQNVNLFKVSMNGDTFSLMVNNKAIGQSVKDVSLSGGSIGMFVNLKGTEVAFTNMLLTRQ